MGGLTADLPVVGAEEGDIPATVEDLVVRISERDERNAGIAQDVAQVRRQRMVDENAADVLLFGRLDDLAREPQWGHDEADVPRMLFADVFQDAGENVQTRRIDDSEREDDILSEPLFPKLFHDARMIAERSSRYKGSMVPCWNLQLIVAEIYIPFWKSI